MHYVITSHNTLLPRALAVCASIHVLIHDRRVSPGMQAATINVHVLAEILQHHCKVVVILLDMLSQQFYKHV